MGRPSTVLTIAMLACLGYFLLPLVWIAVASTKDNSDLFSSFGLWFADDFSLLANLRDVFTYDGAVYGRWLINTALYAVLTAGGGAFLMAAAGYAFAQYKFAGSKVLFGIVLGSFMIPSTALVIPTYLLFSQIGLVNTPLAVILPSLVSPFGIYLMRVYAEGAVPDSLIEAARVDGAGEFRIFWQVTLRLLAPGIVTVLLFSLVGVWNNYFLPLIMLNDPKWFPITVGLAQWQAKASGGGGAEALFSTVITGSMVSIIPLLAAFLFLQRYWVSGMSLGAVKG